MIQADILGKTILVWDKLSVAKVQEIKGLLVSLLDYYASQNINIGIPIPLLAKNTYLTLCNKNENLILYTSKLENEKYLFTPIINLDELYLSKNLLERGFAKINNRMNAKQYMPQYDWINIDFNKAVKSYLLSPNMNPQDFIKSLNNKNQSGLYKKFLHDINISLNNINSQDKIQDLPEEIKIEE